MTSQSTLPSGWREVALGNAIDLTLSSVDKKSKGNESPVLLCNYTDVYKNSFIRSGMEFMAATATEREINRCTLAVGDVVITKDSEAHDDIGVPALVRDNIEGLVCGYHLAILRPKPATIEGMFLLYSLSVDSAQEQFHSYANGITRFGLRKDDIGRVQIPLPPLQEQREIAGVLGALDDKIELNRRMNETLEGMARALFTSWFVDFEPVRAKMDGRWHRGESLPSLPADLWDLFPDRLVDSELGEIPEGWEVKALGEVIELNYGKALKAEDRKAGDVPVYGSNGQIGWHDESLASGPDIIVGRKGNPGYITWTHTAFFPIDTTFYVETKDADLRLPFLYFSLQDQDLPSLSADSAVPGLNRNLAYMNSQLLPAKLVVEAYHQQAMQTLIRRHQLEQESRALAAQRDALLPRLVSGEVRV